MNWPPCCGEMAARIRAFDWSATPLGPSALWPQSLRTLVDIVLGSGHAMQLAWGPERTLIYNDAYAPMLGERHPAALGIAFRDAWPDIWDEIATLVDQVFAGETVRFADMPLVMTRNGYPEDTWWTFSYSPVHDESGAVAGLLNVTVDATGKVRGDQAQDALRESQAQLRELADTLEQQVATRTAERDRMWTISPDLMVEASLEGVYQRANPAWMSILGFESQEVIGKTAADFVHPADMQTMLGALSTAQADSLPSIDLRFRTKDGGYRWIQWVAAPTAGLIFAIGRDVTAAVHAQTQLRETEEALRQSQKMEAVGQLTGGVAHDFNNLLTILRSSIDFLRRPDLTADRRTRYLEAASDTVDRAGKLTGQLLAFARRQALKPEIFDVAGRVRTIADMLDTVTGARVRVVTRLPDEPCHVRADVSQFETAIINMGVNARDAMGGEGVLTITVTCHTPLPSIRGHAGSRSLFTAVEVSDTGAGIDSEDLPRIFEPFYTTKEVGKGTGLGLSQVFGFAKQSGGDIDVTSVSGRGTTFVLYLPEAPAPEVGPAPQAPPAERVPAGTGQCILVVEDNVEVGQFCKQILEDLGYRTALSVTAEEALQRLGSDGNGFDAVFSDVVMPGMGGLALARDLRERLPNLPVLLASGYSHALAMDEHSFEVVQKPYSAAQLEATLKRVMG
jgi:PAS domain S-box-containing protein